MRLVSIVYMAGRDQKSMLVFPIEVNQAGDLIGLRSDRLVDSDIKKLKANARKIADMGTDEAREFLNSLLMSYHAALVEMKKSRYTIIGEHEV